MFFRRRHHSNRIAKQFHANFNDMTLCMDKMHFMMKANTRFGHSDALLIFDIEIFMSFGLELDLELFRG